MSYKENIEELRHQIDLIDDDLLSLINKRANLSLQIRNLKNQSSKPLFDSKREEEVVSRLCKNNNGPLYDQNVKQVFKQIMKINRGLPDE